MHLEIVVEQVTKYMCIIEHNIKNKNVSLS